MNSTTLTGKRLAVVVAVEQYADTRIHPVTYAENDANGFTNALELGGALDRVFLLSGKATKTTINSQVRQRVKNLTADDSLYIFYAGHGFAIDGSNFITCHDTDLDDLEETSVNLNKLLEVCGKSACRRMALFLDSRNSDITDLPGACANMSEKALDQFFTATEHRTCFASCKTTEISHSTGVLTHGVWTYQVIQALKGDDRPALDAGRYVTSVSLQNYLAAEIPRTLRKVFTMPVTQTPRFYGRQTANLVISDLDSFLNRRTAVNPGYDQVKKVFLRIEEPVKISSLSGFKKGTHRIPDGVTSASGKFVHSISRKEVTGEIEGAFERIRGHMKYKRKDLTADDCHIMTPDFEFWVECGQDPEDPAMAIISRELINISPKIVDDDAFNKVFDDCFNDLTIELTGGVDVKDLIDQLEDLDTGKIELDYPSDCSQCEITIEGSPLKVKVTPGSLTVHTPKPVAPKLLVASFFEVQIQLAGSPILKAVTHRSMS